MPIIFRERGPTQDPPPRAGATAAPHGPALSGRLRRGALTLAGGCLPPGESLRRPGCIMSYVRAELPGVKAEDLEITIQDNSLILRGERKIAAEEKQVNYQRRERESGFFRRVLALPSRVQPDKVEATCKDGILAIKLAKPEEVKPRKIKVKVA